MNNGADVNNVGRDGLPLLVHALETAKESTHTCLMILEKGADPNSTDKVNFVNKRIIIVIDYSYNSKYMFT